jgi:hypothetical protein
MMSFDPGDENTINTYSKKNIPNNNDNCDFYSGYAPYHHISPELSETLSESSETLSVRLLISILFLTMRSSVKLTHLPSQTNCSLTPTKSLSQHSSELAKLVVKERAIF